MSKKFYLEVGEHCYARCISCDVYTQHRGYEFYSKVLTLEQNIQIIKDLIERGFSEVRFTGRDPLTYGEFEELTEDIHYLKIKKVINTTLLAQEISAIELCALYDEVIVSLSAVGNQYQSFFGVDKFHILDKNLRTLTAISSGQVTLNYVVTKMNCDMESLNAFFDYVMSLFCQKSILQIMFFPELKYNDEVYSQESINEINDNVIKIQDDFIRSGITTIYTPSFGGKKINKCSVMDRRLYIKSNGDVFPCCNTGGELGQKIYEECCLGNIKTFDFKTTSISVNNSVCSRCTPKYYELMK
jgi:molybdenum cofactor biosynthesis enzyme MoaA